MERLSTLQHLKLLKEEERRFDLQNLSPYRDDRIHHSTELIKWIDNEIYEIKLNQQFTEEFERFCNLNKHEDKLVNLKDFIRIKYEDKDYEEIHLNLNPSCEKTIQRLNEIKKAIEWSNNLYKSMIQ